MEKALEALIDAHLKKSLVHQLPANGTCLQRRAASNKSMESLFGTNYKRSNRSKRGFREILHSNLLSCI